MTSSEGRQKKHHILLVEDEPGMSFAVSALLELEGYKVCVANDGREGLERLHEEDLDLIITDYMMPEMDGGEMIRRIRSDPSYRDIPIILTSAALPSFVKPYDKLADLFIRKTGNIGRVLEALELLLPSK